MEVSITIGGSYDLPPAYAKFQKLGDLYQAIDQEMINKNQEWVRKGKTDHPWGTSSGRANSERLKNLVIEGHQLFSEIFQGEMKAGNFEIFEAENFAPFLHSEEQVPHIRSWLQKDDGVLEGLLEVFKPELTFGFPMFVGLHGSYLNSSQLALLWETYKSLLDSFVPDWVSAEKIESRGPIEVFSQSDIRIFHSIGLAAFFEAVNTPSDVLDQASILTPTGLFNIVSQKRVRLMPRIKFAHNVSFNATPAAVKTLQPDAFLAQIAQHGIDHDVVEMLAPAWTNSFNSFLEAAKSLSAEEAKA